MSVRDTIILNPKDLRYLLIDSLRLYSDNVVLLMVIIRIDFLLIKRLFMF